MGRLSAYREHRNDEHREALIVEAMQYTGLHLEADLAASPYWAGKPLIRRAGVLLFLLDRDVVTRSIRDGRVVYDVNDGAEEWVAAQPSLTPYAVPTIELIAALRREQTRYFPAAG